MSVHSNFVKTLQPTYMTEIYSCYDSTHSTRKMAHRLNQPNRLLDIGHKGISYTGPRMWNDLDSNLKLVNNLNTFKHKIKDMFFKGLQEIEDDIYLTKLILSNFCLQFLYIEGYHGLRGFIVPSVFLATPVCRKFSFSFSFMSILFIYINILSYIHSFLAFLLYILMWQIDSLTHTQGPCIYISWLVKNC